MLPRASCRALRSTSAWSILLLFGLSASCVTVQPRPSGGDTAAPAEEVHTRPQATASATPGPTASPTLAATARATARPAPTATATPDPAREALLDYSAAYAWLDDQEAAINAELRLWYEQLPGLSRERAIGEYREFQRRLEALYDAYRALKPTYPWASIDRHLIRMAGLYQQGADAYLEHLVSGREEDYRASVELHQQGYREALAFSSQLGDEWQRYGISAGAVARRKAELKRRGEVARLIAPPGPMPGSDDPSQPTTVWTTPPATTATPTSTPTSTPTPTMRILDPIPTPLPLTTEADRIAHGATVHLYLDCPEAGPRSGTGAIVGTDGLTFVTAYHVLANASGEPCSGDYLVGPYLNWTLRATLLSYRADLDVAVMRVAHERGLFAVVALGDDQALPVGGTVYTFSYPGRGQGSLVRTGGVLLGRVRFRGHSFDSLISDAVTSPGSSGGIAADHDGRLVGIVFAAPGRRGFEQLGYPQLTDGSAIVPLQAFRYMLP